MSITEWSSKDLGLRSPENWKLKQYKIVKRIQKVTVELYLSILTIFNFELFSYKIYSNKNIRQWLIIRHYLNYKKI